MVATPETLKNNLNLDIRVYNEVVDIDAEAKVVSVRNSITQKTYQESYGLHNCFRRLVNSLIANIVEHQLQRAFLCGVLEGVVRSHDLR